MNYLMQNYPVVTPIVGTIVPLTLIVLCQSLFKRGRSKIHRSGSLTNRRIP